MTKTNKIRWMVAFALLLLFTLIVFKAIAFFGGSPAPGIS